MDRGIITAAERLKVIGNGFETGGDQVTAQEMRYFSLYWDKIVIPTNNFIGLFVHDEDELCKSGILHRPNFQFQGSFDTGQAGNAINRLPFLAAEELINNDLSTNWTLHQLGDKLQFTPEFMDLKRTLRLQLVNLLPVPSGDTPIAEILEFKHKRSDELNALHQHIDDIYIEALTHPDQILGANTAISNLKQNIENLNRVSLEKWYQPTMFDHSIEFNFDAKKLYQGALSGGAFDSLTGGLTFPYGTFIGGVKSQIKLKAAQKDTFKGAGNNTKLAFLSNAHNEDII